MKATKIYYQKCFNLGNYSNEVVGVELEVEAGEKACEVLQAAQKFVEGQSNAKFNKELLSKAKNIISNPDDYTGKDVKYAKSVLDEQKEMTDDLPF
jgi:hypothetical protein